MVTGCSWDNLFSGAAAEKGAERASTSLVLVLLLHTTLLEFGTVVGVMRRKLSLVYILCLKE